MLGKRSVWTEPTYRTGGVVAVVALLVISAAAQGETPPPGQVGPTGQGGQPAETTVTWFAGSGRAMKPLLADQREAQVRGGFSTARHGNTFADVGFGGDVAVFNAVDRQDVVVESVSIRGLFTARFQMNSASTNQLNTDYIGGAAYGRRHGPDSWEVFIYHQSSHLGDETLDFGDRRRIDYGRESVRLLWSHDVSTSWRFYGGPTFNIDGVPFLRYKTTIQAGAEYRFEAWGRPMYVAGDLQCRETNDWRPGFCAQVGLELGDPKSLVPRPRLFVELYTGYSNMGQYWNAYETSLLVGVGYNW